MNNPYKLSLLSAVCSAILLTGCGDAKTTVTEKERQEIPQPAPSDHTIESQGRLAIIPASGEQVALFDLDDQHLLDEFATTYPSSSISASAGYRYVVIKNREHGHVGFIDSGLWREDHVAHLHDYEQAPTLLNFQINSTQPTHIVTHDGAMAIFNDGHSESGVSASVNLLTDEDITAEKSESQAITFEMNMHGVAEPRGDFLLATVRRDDQESTSTAKILPDQVAIYHQHGTDYERERILEILCPNLHGAAQSNQFVAFGCSDGVLLAQQSGEEFISSKIANTDVLGSARIGKLYGHEEHDDLFGVASVHGGPSKLMALNPISLLMVEVDWQPLENATAKYYAFSADGDIFTILDSQGYLTTLTPHTHDGATEWEFAQRVDISQQDVALMPDGQSFKLTMSQHDDIAYVSDPIAKQVIAIDLTQMSTTTLLDLDYVPGNIVWLGIKEAHSH